MDPQVPYLHSSPKLRAMLDKIREAGQPDRFTHKFLVDLEFRSRFDRPFIGLLKYLGMLNASGQPTESYSLFRDESQTQKVLSACVATAYDDLFMAHPNAAGKEKSELTGWFKSKSHKSETTAGLMAGTFLTLCQYAGMTGSSPRPPSRKAVQSSLASPGSAGGPRSDGRAPAVGTSLSVHIEVKLGGDARDYDAFFAALKKHIVSSTK